MKLRVFFTLFFITLVSFAVFNLWHSIQLRKIEKEIEEAQFQMNKSAELAEDLVLTSQWQTRLARSYVINSQGKNDNPNINPQRLNWYNRMNEILDGKAARPDNYGLEYWDLVVAGLIEMPEKPSNGVTIEDSFIKLGITTEEFNSLKEARTLLSKMGAIEIAAMHFANGEFDDGTGTFIRKGKPDISKATNLLWSEEYLKKNGELSFVVSKFRSQIISRFTKGLDKQRNVYNLLLALNNYMAYLVCFLVLATVIFMQFNLIKPATKLLHVVRSISSGDLSIRTEITGNDEIGQLAKAVDTMSHNLLVSFEKLEDKIELSQQALSELDKEKTRSDKLLHNILPAAIATRLRDGEETIAEVYPEVTVCFSDIVGFTDLSTQLGPHGTVNMLNELFGQFDELAEKHHVEKIKTIGDCYMVVGGVPNRDPYHCQHIAEFALDAVKVLEEISSSSQLPIKMRMGIHTGTVAAGVVGKKKFSYDLWGDVVNIASRFETTSLPDKIHVSEAVRVRLEDDFLFHNSGSVEFKGKGTQQSYFLLGKKQELASIVQFKKN